MTKPTILVIFGTRPEAIKLFPVIHALRETGRVRVRTCVTAQHRGDARIRTGGGREIALLQPLVHLQHVAEQLVRLLQLADMREQGGPSGP